MSFLNNIVSLVASMEPMWGYSLNYLFVLAFICTIPYIFDSFWRK